MSISQGIVYIGQAPAGVTSNAVDPPSLETLSIILFSLLMGFNVTFVCFRVIFKWRTGIAKDDVFIVLAAILGIAQTTLILSLTKYARHGWDIPLDWFNASYMKRMLYAQTLLAYGSLLFAKVSILLLYLRVFSFTASKTVRYIIYFGIFWTVATYAPAVITASWYCAPHVGEKWGLNVALRCRDFDVWQIGSSSMAIALDVFILGLPMPLLGRLHLSKGKKIGIAGMFSTASLATTCAILTLVYRIRLRSSAEPFWTSWQATIFNIVENNVAIIVACVPSTFSFLKKYVLPSRLPSIFTPPTGSSSKHSRNNSSRSAGSLGGLTPHISSPRCLNSPGHLQHYKELRDVKNVKFNVYGEKVYGEGPIGGGVSEGGDLGVRGGNGNWSTNEDKVDRMLRQMEMEQRNSHFSF